MTNNTCVVVGGGVVGLLSAYLAKQKFERVVLVERSKNLGGLLGSFDIEGARYDYGTHLPALTNIEELNQILFGTESERTTQYDYFPYLRSENYFNGKWHLTSPLMNTSHLPQEQYTQGVVELLEAPGAEGGELNLYRYLISTFGETFTEKVYRPVLKKLLGSELEDINKGILTIFGLLRLIALTPEVTMELKKMPKYNNSLGYHSYKDGGPGYSYCYPKGNVGIGYWPDYLLDKIKSEGVEIITDDSVAAVSHVNQEINQLTLKGGATIDCCHVIWTVPPVLALMAAGIEFTSVPPAFRTHTLCHYEFEKPFLKTVPQYLLCWDASMLSYRITLYPNISDDRAAVGKYNLTVEVLSDKTAEHRTEEIKEIVLAELRKMQVVSDDNKLLHSAVEYMGNSFPILTTPFLENAKKIQDTVNHSFNNITLLGRGAGATFFINDLLIEAYQKVKDLDVVNG